jgi:hypothetical protein
MLSRCLGSECAQMCPRSLLESGLASGSPRIVPICVNALGRQFLSIDNILSVALASKLLHASARILPAEHLSAHTPLVACLGLSRSRMRNGGQRSDDDPRPVSHILFRFVVGTSYRCQPACYFRASCVDVRPTAAHGRGAQHILRQASQPRGIRLSLTASRCEARPCTFPLLSFDEISLSLLTRAPPRVGER